jgi:hypothetical protein
MLPKIQMKIEEPNVCKFRSTCILNTFSIDENLKRLSIHSYVVKCNLMKVIPEALSNRYDVSALCNI